jgi:Kef-type K+ transport system membrane component KefB
LAPITDALGVQTVLGAFVAGLLIGESPIPTKHTNTQLRGMITSFFAPIFFAPAGLSSYLTVDNVMPKLCYAGNLPERRSLQRTRSRRQSPPA